MTSNTSIYKLRNGAANIRIPGVAASLLIVAGIVTVLVITQSVEAALATFAAATFFTLLFIVPTFWLAILLIALIPFQTLITQSLGGFEASTRQVFASWKELVLI